MKLTLIRDIKGDTFTLGTLHINDIRTMYTCEDAVRQRAGIPVEHWKIPGETAIPVGTYRVIRNFSNRFKKHMPLLLDVKGFEGIRIHNGNTEKDTEGCILVGEKRNANSVLESRAAYKILDRAIEEAIKRGASVTIEIR